MTYSLRLVGTGALAEPALSDRAVRQSRTGPVERSSTAVRPVLAAWGGTTIGLARLNFLVRGTIMSSVVALALSASEETQHDQDPIPALVFLLGCISISATSAEEKPTLSKVPLSTKQMEVYRAFLSS